MRLWARYGLALAITLALAQIPVYGIVVGPLIGGLAYGFAPLNKTERNVGLTMPMAAYGLILAYYALVDIERLARYLSLFPIFVALGLAVMLVMGLFGLFIGINAYGVLRTRGRQQAR